MVRRTMPDADAVSPFRFNDLVLDLADQSGIPPPALTLTSPTCKEVAMADISPITTARFWSKVAVEKRDDVCWTWGGAMNGSGYGCFRVPELGRKTVSAHRFAFRLGTGAWPSDGELVRHKCYNPKCVNPHHLEVGDHVDNARDMVERNRARSGDTVGASNGNARLTADNVHDVRRMIDSGLTNTAIGAYFGVHHATISAIRRGRSWAA